MSEYTARDATILTMVSQNPGCSQKIFDRLIAKADEEKTRTVAKKIRDEYRKSMSCNRIMRQFNVDKDIGLTMCQAEVRFGVEIRSLTIDDSDKLYHGRLISVEGEHDDVYRFFDEICPGVLSEEQRNSLKRVIP